MVMKKKKKKKKQTIKSTKNKIFGDYYKLQNKYKFIDKFIMLLCYNAYMFLYLYRKN